MRELETFVVGYTAAFAVWAIVARDRAHPVIAVLVSLATIATVLLIQDAPVVVRLLAPQLYLVAGYWIPALVIRRDAHSLVPSRFEQWLNGTDAYFRERLPHVPSALVTSVETAYLLCYPVVPLTLALVWWRAGAAAVPRYWATVIVAGFACYATLPWLLSRPPQRHGLSAIALRQTNRYVLARVSHTWTTFPSGHVAVSFAAAFAVLRVWPTAGALLLILAAGIGVGAAAGRYHYVVDVLLGLIVAVVAVVIT